MSHRSMAAIHHKSGPIASEAETAECRAEVSRNGAAAATGVDARQIRPWRQFFGVERHEAFGYVARASFVRIAAVAGMAPLVAPSHPPGGLWPRKPSRTGRERRFQL